MAGLALAAWRLLLAVALPVGGFIAAGWGGAFLAVLLYAGLREILLGPAAIIALERLGHDPALILTLQAQARVRRWRRIAAAVSRS